VRKLIFLALAQSLLLLGGCGGGGGGVATSNNNGGGGGGGGQPGNSVAITVDSGPDPTSGVDADTPFVTVTVCAPGSTSTCQTIDHVEVDTGSYGLRIIASVLNSSLATALQPEPGSGSGAYVECTQFVDGYSWGPVKLADVQIASESASNVPVQIIGDPSYQSAVPSACSSVGTAENTVAAFGANGILGVGPFADDCGSYCAKTLANTFYYACPANGNSSSCANATVAESLQVTDPVVYFPTDNNGVVVEIPSTAEGAATASGTLLFGIGTETNNSITTQTVLMADAAYGDISTAYTTQSNKSLILPFSYIDTGSNAYYFTDDGIPSLTACSSYPGYSTASPQAWFCPASELKLSATNSSTNGLQSTVSLSIGNAYTLFNTYQTGTVFNDLGASSGAPPADCTSATTDTACAFDFGFPFFLGKSVFIAFAGSSTSWGTGPFYAY
jgi:hypothetical protein